MKTKYYIKQAGDKWREVKHYNEETRFGVIFLRYQIGQEIGLAKPGDWKKEEKLEVLK